MAVRVAVSNSTSWRAGSATGWALLVRPVAAAHRRELLALAGWSLLEALPVLASGQLVMAALDRGFLAGNALIGLAMLACYGATIVVGAFATRQAMTPIAAVVESLRDHVMRSVVRGSLCDAVLRDRPAETGAVARITRQTETVRQVAASLLLVMRTVVFGVVAALVGLATIALPVALVALPSFALATILLVRVSRVWRGRYQHALAAEERLAEHAERIVTGLRDVLACAAVDRAQADIDRDMQAYAAATVRVSTIGACRIGVFSLGARIPLIALLLLAPWLVANGTLTAGAVLGAATYLMTGLEPALRTLVEAVGNLGVELSTLLHRLATCSVSPPPSAARGSQVGDHFAVAMRKVTFRYGPHSQPVLDNLDLDIAHGEHIAVVGPSGVGKSTLAGVLTGLHEPERGSVQLGDHLVQSLRESWLREIVALVPQQAYVCAGTVLDNLRYLNPAASDAQLRRAVSVLGAERLVADLGGLDATIEHPSALSDGERQLLVLTRVFVSRARVVILDEATCHLDPVAEARVESAFARRGGTLVVIAHRISSALRADRVIVLDGAGLHTGTHAQLCLRSATYADLVGYWHA